MRSLTNGIIVLLTLLLARPLWGQTDPPSLNDLRQKPCDCPAANRQSAEYIPSAKVANQLVQDMLADISRYSAIRFDSRIMTFETSCFGVIARVCDVTKEGQRRFIFYNNTFLDSITQRRGSVTWIDRFVLAHEIGHHVLGHLRSQREFDRVAGRFNAETPGRQRIRHSVQIANWQADELEADFFALWLLYRLNPATFRYQDLASNFDSDYFRIHFDNDAKYLATHPPLAKRLAAMQALWVDLQRPRNALAQAPRSRDFAAAASEAYVNLNPDRPYYDLLLTAGPTVAGRPAFSVNGQPVAAQWLGLSDGWSGQVGLTVSRFNWQKRWRWELEASWNRLQVGTLLTTPGGKRLLERLDINQLMLQPKVAVSSVGLGGGWGLLAGLGLAVRVPLSLTYRNFGQPDLAAPGLGLSVSPRLSVGAEWLPKTYRPRHLRLALTYEPVPLRLLTTPAPSATLHTLDLTVSYALRRW